MTDLSLFGSIQSLRVRSLLSAVFGRKVTADLSTTVCAFQKCIGVEPDGIVGEVTGPALEASASARTHPLLRDFKGEVGFLLVWEGHNGSPYWPGGQAGLTLDPGFDLGYQNVRRFLDLYEDVFEGPAQVLLLKAIGLRGQPAASLAQSPECRAIGIERNVAARILTGIAAPYWRDIANRFETLRKPDTPPVVHTVLLSLAYNRGAQNPDLEQLAVPLQQSNWNELAEHVAGMQQTHPLQGIRARRRAEAALLRALI